ncbi:CopD family protein [Haloarcula salina]|uniref:CopD family protein n=1 Tax=Haloarcula salina TaxID=1429914 RepID=UPI003C6EA697
MGALTSLAIRTLHVLAMAVLVGGSAAAWYGYRSGAVDGLAAADRFEWLFWAGVGALVLTGVGNLGALGPPGPTTDWGRTLLVKLTLVVGLVCGSAVRTLVVVRAREAVRPVADGGRESDDETDPEDCPANDTPDSPSPDPHRAVLSKAYGATTGLLLVLVVLAEVLAHG